MDLPNGGRVARLEGDRDEAAEKAEFCEGTPGAATTATCPADTPPQLPDWRVRCAALAFGIRPTDTSTHPFTK